MLFESFLTPHPQQRCSSPTLSWGRQWRKDFHRFTECLTLKPTLKRLSGRKPWSFDKLVNNNSYLQTAYYVAGTMLYSYHLFFTTQGNGDCFTDEESKAHWRSHDVPWGCSLSLWMKSVPPPTLIHKTPERLGNVSPNNVVNGGSALAPPVLIHPMCFENFK